MKTIAILTLAASLASPATAPAQDARMTGPIPALDLAFFASDAVVIGAAARDASGAAAIRVDEVLAGQVPGRVLRLASGARTGLHVHAPATRALLFVYAQRGAGGRVFYKLCQHPGSVLQLGRGAREARVRELVGCLALLEREAVGCVHALLGFAERHKASEAMLAASALRSLARRGDLVQREAMSGAATRLAALLADTSAPGRLRAEAACCLAASSESRALTGVLSALRDDANAGFGVAVAPLLVQLDRRTSAARLADVLTRARPGQHGEVLACLHAMGSADSRRTLAKLYADPTLGPALQRSMRSGSRPSRSKIR